VNVPGKLSLPGWLPYVVGAVLVVQFAALGAWQISRGLDKRESRAAYREQGTFAAFRHGIEVRPYQAVEAAGRYLGDKQFLLDNIILNSRYGYYVLTALETAEDEPLLIVNRGWIEKSGPTPEVGALTATIKAPTDSLSVRGRVGSLPKPGMRMGEAITSRDTWPQIAVWPTSEDLANSLGREVQPFVLLMDPDAENGFTRHWVPEEMGPGKHFGYALQWFAMGAVLAGLLIWNFRRRRESHD
jgi:cytochrome oxidase assembly protein ShyY1